MVAIPGGGGLASVLAKLSRLPVWWISGLFTLKSGVLKWSRKASGRVRSGLRMSFLSFRASDFVELSLRMELATF